MVRQEAVRVGRNCMNEGRRISTNPHRRSRRHRLPTCGPRVWQGRDSSRLVVLPALRRPSLLLLWLSPPLGRPAV